MITELDVGGAERALVALATGLDRRRWAPSVLALGPEDDLDATLGVALKVREDVDRVREKGVLAGT